MNKPKSVTKVLPAASEEVSHRFGDVISAWNVPPSDEKARQYSDAELYRILIAGALREGQFPSKASADAYVGSLSTIETADQVLSFSLLRPDCKAWRRGKLMICECGSNWPVDSQDPPPCRTGHD